MKSLGLKILFISILIITLLIPILLVSALVSERQDRKAVMINEISQVWGNQQTLQEITLLDSSGNKYIADQVTLNGTLNADIRYKGIFSIPLYTVDLTINGTFDKSLIDKTNKIKLLLSDASAIEIKSCQIGGINISNDKKQISTQSINFLVPKNSKLLNNRFSIHLVINGLDSLQFTPLGKSTEINIHSNWDDPNFLGNRLPKKRTVTNNGFDATWIVNQTNLLTTSKQESFGISLFVPVDIYKLTDRSIKYAILFIFLTFLTFFLFEILSKIDIHLMQYLLVGLALTIFYLLLLALSEHIAFLVSYLVATASTITLISLYCKKILHNTARSLIVTGTLILLYTFLLTLLMLEEYSLLLGSFGLFAILALVMYLTRNINWYKISDSRGEQKKS